MQAVALISGLIGAIASAALGFLVRLVLDRRAQKEAEMRLAFVYLIRVSNVVAAELALKSVIKTMISAEALKEFTKSDSEQFEASHKLSAMLAEGLQKLSTEEIRAEQGYRALPRLVSSQLESAKEVKLTSEQLSKLPRDIVFLCAKFQTSLSHVVQVVESWGAFFENDERYWVTPEGIHDQWMTLVRFAGAAQELRRALIRFGAATPEEARELLSNQIDSGLEVMRAKWADKPKLAAAIAARKAASSEHVDKGL